MQLFMHTLSYDTITFEVHSLDTLEDFKAKITRNKYNVSKWHINWKSEQIFVIAPHDENICIGYKCSDTISDLKSKISHREFIIPEGQTLFFAGMLLDDHSSPISHYNISHGSTLNLVRRFGRPTKIFVVITTTGKTLPLQVTRHFPAWRVKRMVQDKTGIDLVGQILVNVNAGVQLVNKQSLHCIEDRTTLYLLDETVIKSRNEIKIYVKIYPSRKTIELNVVNFDTISSVKSMIQETEHISIDQQILYLPQKRLEDTFTLADYYIMNESTLFLQTTSHTVRYPQEEETKKETEKGVLSGSEAKDGLISQQHQTMQLCCGGFVVDVDGSDTFHNLKERLQDKGYDLGGWHINFESKIDPNSLMPKVLVRFPTGKTITLRFCEEDTICYLKRMIYSAEFIPPGDQMLFFAGLHLDNHDTLSDYKIYPEFTLDSMLEFRGDLRVKTTSREIISMLADVNLTIRKVKDLIEEKTRVTTGQRRLVNLEAGEELVDTRILGSCLLENNTILRLVEDACMMLRNEMKVYVRIVATGDTIELDVVSCDTIRTLKNMIQEKQNIPAGLQILYLPQKRLEDTFTLAHYYIMNETTLHLAQIQGIPQDLQELTMNREGSLMKRQKLCA